jgi:hypothetical protein
MQGIVCTCHIRRAEHIAPHSRASYACNPDLWCEVVPADVGAPRGFLGFIPATARRLQQLEQACQSAAE